MQTGHDLILSKVGSNQNVCILRPFSQDSFPRAYGFIVDIYSENYYFVRNFLYTLGQKAKLLNSYDEQV